MKKINLTKNILSIDYYYIFFILYLLVGIFIYQDYGISCDERFNRQNGVVTINYLYAKDPFLLEYYDNDYGVLFEAPLIILERIFRYSNQMQSLFFLRHLATFLLFYIGVYYFYLLCLKQFKNKNFALLGSLFLVLSPRIFAHSFYNSKDIAFLVFFIIAIYYLIKFFNKKNYRSLLIHALTSAFLIDVRIIGVLVPVFSTLLFFREFIFDKKNLKKYISFFIFYLLFLIIFTIAFWPYLWKDPINNFIIAWDRMSHFPWPGKVLYFGKYILPKDLPWHYIFFWIGVTTPISCLFLFLFANLATLLKFLKKPINFIKNNKNLIVYLAWFWAPIFAVLILKSSIYDGYRQLFFIYPALIILSLYGLENTLRIKKIIKIILTFIIVDLILVLCFMIKNHPHQQVYFNFIVGKNYKNISKNFDFDYWGLSYRQGLEFLSNNIKEAQIKVYAHNYVAKDNLYILNPEDAKRIKFVDNISEADYYISNFRDDKFNYYDYEEIFSVKVKGANLMGVFKLN